MIAIGKSLLITQLIMNWLIDDKINPKVSFKANALPTVAVRLLYSSLVCNIRNAFETLVRYYYN